MLTEASGTAESRGPVSTGTSWLTWLRSAIGQMDLLVGALLVLLLLPLVLGPFVVVYMLAKDGAYALAGFVGAVFGTAGFSALRAVRRGHFSPGTVGAVWAIVVAALLIALAWVRWAAGGS